MKFNLGFRKCFPGGYFFLKMPRPLWQGVEKFSALDEDDGSRSEERLESLPVVPLAPGAGVPPPPRFESFSHHPDWPPYHTGEDSFWLCCLADEQQPWNCLWCLGLGRQTDIINTTFKIFVWQDLCRQRTYCCRPTWSEIWKSKKRFSTRSWILQKDKRSFNLFLFRWWRWASPLIAREANLDQLLSAFLDSREEREDRSSLKFTWTRTDLWLSGQVYWQVREIHPSDCKCHFRGKWRWGGRGWDCWGYWKHREREKTRQQGKVLGCFALFKVSVLLWRPGHQRALKEARGHSQQYNCGFGRVFPILHMIPKYLLR